MFDFLVGLQVAGIIIVICALVFSFRGEGSYAQKLMMAFMVAELVHTAGFLGELFATSLNEAMMAVKFEYLGSSVVAIFYMMFIRHYCGQKEWKLLERFLLVCACIVIVMVWTTPYHTFYYQNIDFIESGIYPHLVLTYGPGFVFFIVCCTMIPWLISMVVILQSYMGEKNRKRRGKLQFIIFGTSFELLTLLLYVLKVFPEGYDPTAISMAFMLSILVFFVWNRKDFVLIRAAADTMLNVIDVSIITLNEKQQVLNYNEATKRLFSDIEQLQKVENIKGFPAHIIGKEEKTTFEWNDRCYEGYARALEDYDGAVRGYSVMFSDVTDTQEYIREITEMREKAESANQAKSDFLANMSHEIRTPMNAVVGMSELIIEECYGSKMYDYACDIKAAALNLLSIINDILDLSKVEAGKMELVEDTYDIHKLVEETVTLVRIPAEQKGLQMKLEIAEDIPNRLYGDYGRIRQVLINLLNNSIKFTKDGYVWLRVWIEKLNDERIRLQFIVKDTGIGIKEEDMNTIFEAFQQLDMDKNKKIEGTGLGLAITKRLVQLMQGDLQVESVYGEGTTFKVCIEQKVVEWRSIQETSVQQDVSKETQMKECIYKDCNILVVDDNRMNRKVAVAMLRLCGIDYDEADSGMAAIELVKENKYDMILMDYMMPELDGVETTHIIRTTCGEYGETVTIIALTANAIQGAREMYLENGFQDFLSKPFEKKQLMAMLERWIPKEKRI